jgi:hypothetical protein
MKSNHPIETSPIKIQQWKINNIITINDNSNNDIIDDVIINYWHKELQSTKNNENLLFDLNGWLYNQHTLIAMQILYIQQL